MDHFTWEWTKEKNLKPTVFSRRRMLGGDFFSLFWYSHLHLDLLHQPVAQTPVLKKKDQSASQRKHYSTECFTQEIQHSAVLYHVKVLFEFCCHPLWHIGPKPSPANGYMTFKHITSCLAIAKDKESHCKLRHISKNAPGTHVRF